MLICAHPPSSALLDVLFAALQQEKKLQPNPSYRGQPGSLQEKALLLPEPHGTKQKSGNPKDNFLILIGDQLTTCSRLFPPGTGGLQL